MYGGNKSLTDCSNDTILGKSLSLLQAIFDPSQGFFNAIAFVFMAKGVRKVMLSACSNLCRRLCCFRARLPKVNKVVFYSQIKQAKKKKKISFMFFLDFNFSKYNKKHHFFFCTFNVNASFFTVRRQYFQYIQKKKKTDVKLLKLKTIFTTATDSVI
ncbi:hypothetical protein RFI_10188 [Reticulomyxa filosa]|uniref:Uncharacterized protein n=1 Tax=Reticulomyxa filosa TaxID=46433 RepID=X6NNK5_RETFI|nr:hypothetical protein RFI_10188 [Reticulomyxa filosa]|eukprot:ETO26947.1 hypothetical protein RFI_10188 [Reticulomyxa filosa]